jgi:hypothetical protein
MLNLAQYRRSSTHLTDKIAKALDVTLPRWLLGRADRMIMSPIGPPFDVAYWPLADMVLRLHEVSF